MTTTGYSRSSIYLRLNASPTSKVIEVLKPSDPVEVLEEAGNMFVVKSSRLLPPIVGYVVKSSIVSHQEPSVIFPRLDLGNGTEIDSVPPSLPAVEFETWLHEQAEPAWLSNNGGTPFPVGERIRNVFANYQTAWESWFADVAANNRTGSATMDEWFTILNGGKEMWSFRTERIFKEPTERSAGLGWVAPKDILHWTGRVWFNDREPKYKLWYEVQLTKLDREMTGWYKAVLLEEFVLPEKYIDPYDPTVTPLVFDFSSPLLRLPTDPEIAEAKAAGRRAYQYINVKNAIGWSKINYNLCGEFCVAALCGSDVIPFLKQWYGTGLRPKMILEKDYGTVIYDLQPMLQMFNKKSEIFYREASIAPASPGYLERMLRSGKKAIMGVGVTTTGKVAFHGRVRHWIVLEDIVRMGSSGWLRVYNPYFNREENYPYQVLFEITASGTLGLWVED
jgi:hypothetical protein